MIQFVRPEVLVADDDTNLIVDEVYKKSSLFIVTHAFEVLQLLLSTQRLEK